MDRAVGCAPSTIQQIWQAFGILGLYLVPPEQALVLCVDDKSQIQALDPI